MALSKHIPTFSTYRHAWFKDRKIGADVIRDFGLQLDVHDGRQAIRIPTQSGLFRWRFLDGQEPRFKWPPTGGPTKDEKLYYADDLPQRIHAAGGALWIASGESDLWALHSADIKNALTWHDGENSIPATLHEQLATWGVQTIYYVPDNDDAGRLAASKLGAALPNLTIYQLPEGTGDIGEAWQQFTADRDKAFERRMGDNFKAWLGALPVYEVACRSPQSPVDKTSHLDDDLIHPDFKQAVRNEVEHRLAQMGQRTTPNAKGWYRPIHSPFRHDATPSLAICIANGSITARDVSRGETYNIFQLADALGVACPAPQRQPEEKSSGLHGITRQRLLRCGYGHLARLVDALYLEGWEAGRIFNAKDVYTNVEGVSKHLTYKALGSIVPPDEDSPKHVRGIFSAFCQPSLSCSDKWLDAKTQKKSRGRPRSTYQLPSPVAIAQAVGITWDMSHMSPDPITPEALTGNMRAYRVEVLRGFVERKPGKHSRQWLANLVGVSVSTVRDYDKQAGLVVTPTYQTLYITAKTLANIPTREQVKTAHAVAKICKETDQDVPDEVQTILNYDAQFWFIETVDGRKQRAVRENVERIFRLSTKQRVVIKRRSMNKYQVEESPEAEEADVTALSATPPPQPEQPRPPRPAPAEAVASTTQQDKGRQAMLTLMLAMWCKAAEDETDSPPGRPPVGVKRTTPEANTGP